MNTAQNINTISRHEVNDATPHQLDEFVGQKRVVDQLKVALQAARNDNHRLPPILFVGPAGVGKTQLAHILAREMESEIHEQLGHNLTVETLRGFLMESKSKEIAFIDEIHLLKRKEQSVLFRAMDERLIILGSANRRQCRVPLENFTLIGATTDLHCLRPPLISRFRMTLFFDFYSEEELTSLLKIRGGLLGWQVEDECIYGQIACRARGIPRIALSIMEGVWRVARSRNRFIIRVDDLGEACRLEGLDDRGLGQHERKYLKILNYYREPVRLNVIATRVGLAPQTVSTNIESFLLRIGLINKLKDGRMITDDGLQHLASTCEGNLK
ncbi:MAG: Holliday junction DNA helicase RuvB C-terminal domain-containing protein [Phycisphaerae bacterium]